MKKILIPFTVLALSIAVSSCDHQTWKNINYLQDIDETTTTKMPVNNGIIIQPQDQLSIIVTSRRPDLAAPFNLPIASTYAGGENISSAQHLSGYTVDNSGEINYPSLGKIKVSGMNRWQLQEEIADRLSSTGLLKDAIVTVEFMNFKISVLGDVTRPGTYTVTSDKITIFQAIALASDLTVYGQRDNIKVVREQNGKRQVFVLDLRDSNVFNSPAYYLQQNDVVYVTPNEVRAGQSTINENYFKSGSFWISVGSIAITVTNLIITILRK